MPKVTLQNWDLNLNLFECQDQCFFHDMPSVRLPMATRNRRPNQKNFRQDGQFSFHKKSGVRTVSELAIPAILCPRQGLKCFPSLLAVSLMVTRWLQLCQTSLFKIKDPRSPLAESLHPTLISHGLELHPMPIPKQSLARGLE